MPQELSPSQALQAGIAHQQAGRLPQAEQIYRKVLEVEPDNPDALHLLGTIAHHVGKHDKAIELIETALRLQPSNAVYLNNLGNSLKALGRLAEAEGRYREAVKASPVHGHAYYNLACTLQELGRLDEAEAGYGEALRLLPDLTEAHYNLGNLLLQIGKSADAEASYRHLLRLRPQQAEAHNNLGNALKNLGRLAEAESSFRKALECNPRYAYAHYNLGTLLHDSGRLEEAEQRYRQGLELQPALAEAHYNLGNLLQRTQRLTEAERSYRQALALKPANPEAYYNLGMALQALGRRGEAETIYGQALRLRPDYPEAHCLWVHQKQHLCQWDGLMSAAQVLRERVGDGSWRRVFPFTFLALPETGAAEQRRCAQQFAESEFRPLFSHAPFFQGKGRRKAKLRIGYLSADFHEHATSYLLPEVIERHDRRRFEIYGYAYGRDDNSAVGKRIRSAFDVLRSFEKTTDEDAARRILDDSIDILVDLKGYTENARIQICAMRPAPLTVSWLGYPGTLGDARLADYFVGDPVASPLEHAGHYSERLALMPNCYQPNDTRREIGPRPSRAGAGLPAEGFVFCTFNRSYKITSEILDVWCRLLGDVPGSVLWLLKTLPEAERNLVREAAARGVEPQRLIFAPRQPLTEHLGRLQLADLALDTYPVTSHTTASDALWAGVPLLTRIGETFVSRVAASILTAAGLRELVTQDAESYYRLALQLATEPARLKKIKSKLSRGRDSCPLFDSGRFVRDLEDLYKRMWRNHEAGKLAHVSPRKA